MGAEHRKDNKAAILTSISTDSPSDAISTLLTVMVQHAGGDFVGVQDAAAIFFGQTYLVRELLAAEAFFVFAFLGVTVVVGAIYLIGSVTMSWWAQGKPDVEEVHADLRQYRFMNYNQQYTNQQPLSHDSQPVPLRGLSYPGLISGQEESRMH